MLARILLKEIRTRIVFALIILALVVLSPTVWAGVSGSYPSASYNGLSFPSYSLSGATIDKSSEDDNWTRTLNWNGRLEPGGVLRIAGTAKREGGSGPGVLNGRLKVTVEVDGSPAATFNKDLIGNDQIVPFDVSVPIGPTAKEGRVLVELYGIFGNGQTRNIRLSGIFTNAGSVAQPPVQTPITQSPSVPISTESSHSGAHFSSVSGQVKVWHDGKESEWRTAKIDTVLLNGDHIVTDEDAFVVISFADMSTYTLKPESHIVLLPPTGKESKLALVAGNIWVNFKQMIKDGAMEVDMAQAFGTIKGTTFELWETGARQSSIIKVTEGVVSFRNKTTGETVDVSAGQTVTATPTGFVNNWALFNWIKDKETILFFNGNDRAVSGGGQPPWFYLSTPAIISYIMTYHWNDGRGAPAGTITLRREDGTTFGPLKATLVSGVYWEAPTDILLRPGRYQVIDSDPSTWSQNQGDGHVRVKGFRQY